VIEIYCVAPRVILMLHLLYKNLTIFCFFKLACAKNYLKIPGIGAMCYYSANLDNAFYQKAQSDTVCQQTSSGTVLTLETTAKLNAIKAWLGK
jgi:hypothetical protein